MPLEQINNLREKWLHQRTTTNGWLTIPNSFVAEIMARAGFDSLCIDMQHGLVDLPSAIAMLQATQGNGIPTVIRAPWNEASVLMRILDAGADGVIVPMIDSAEEAEEAVAACRYPPRGRRSAGPIRAGLIAEGDYFATAAESALVFVMIETTAALDDLDRILDTPGLSGVYIGPSDLSLSMGFPPETDSTRPQHQAAIKRVIAACHERGLAVGLHTAGPPFAARAASWGIDFATIATDASALRLDVARRVKEFAEMKSAALP